jgi:hypothetical protein
VRILSKIDLPKLMLIGGQSVESNPAFADLPAAFAEIAQTDSHLEWMLVPEADINYRNDPAEVWRVIRAWVERI